MKVNNDYILKKALDSNILVNLKNNGYFVIKLNDTSADIFNHVKNGKNREEIIRLLINEYDVDKDVLIKDFDEFVNNMLEKKIFIND